ncbi:osmoprotectant transport system ATP-binding protein [Promicromonospora sp. AC04]|uniref:ABC transporter ATP-binding protein n=1 Tax=Promicromonospora sp. AC04 TaxID=2135723 RepID=UPI000D3B4BFA|nr:ATP-binding cassette domain-containing protein [Promicromonospora sp. AC04]PUB29754.1 osmoprotectant transport system ATP-binding protein [Promicromonospora sp. AC04]
MITFEHVSKVYPDGTHAVHDLTFDAPSGRLTVLVGPSGCGKTTSMRMINRLIDPTEGVVSLDGEDTRSVDAIDLRRKIGYVIQSAGLFPHRTVVDNVAALPRLLGAGKKEARADALALLEKVGLDERYALRYPYQLSGGQQQRVGVARALATDPPFLLMDEPFSAVDPVVRTQLQDSFLQLQRDIGKTIVMVTHDIDEALKLGDRVAVFREGGTLAQVATPAELLAHPADPFVADFVGASRGYRALGFVEATATVRLAEEVTVRVGARPADVGGADPSTGSGQRDGWSVVVDDDGAPLGWVDLKATGEVVEERHIDFSGTVARADGSLRDLLDAALSSPTGRGLVAGPDGRLRGSVVADEVLRHLGRGREAEVAS